MTALGSQGKIINKSLITFLYSLHKNRDQRPKYSKLLVGQINSFVTQFSVAIQKFC